MSNVSISKHSNNGKNKGIAPLAVNLPYIDDFFDKFAGSWPFMRPGSPTLESTDMGLAPKVDIVEDDQSYTLSAELPGLDLDNINLDLSDGILTLSGEKKTKKEEDKNGNYHLAERSYGYFKRSFSLPPSVEEDKISADFKKGVLHVSMPKSEKAQQNQRKIQIKE
ncbi:MAG: HSP20 family protein [Paraglaciecola sp.]|jgi:HSP20 family protein